MTQRVNTRRFNRSVRVGDVGAIITVDFDEDVSGAIGFTFAFKPENTDAFELDGELDPDDTTHKRARYVTAADTDLVDDPGEWEVQVKATLPSSKVLRSQIGILTVEKALIPPLTS